jgi:predicted HAD superfamily Cof-like phosphohydrolase
MIADAFYDVAEFHRACDVPTKFVPAFPPDERVDLRASLVNEEVNKELLVAIENRDMVGVADGIADSIYVLIGMALEFGVPLPEVWRRVHGANMLKLDPLTHKVNRRKDGKVLKPEGWQPPDIRGALIDSGWVPE